MIIFIVAWCLSANICSYLQAYAPTNIAIAWLRTRRGINWAIPAALVVTPGCAWAADALVSILDRGGPPWLGFFAMLCVWNAFKFTLNALITPFRLAVSRQRRRRLKTLLRSQMERGQQPHSRDRSRRLRSGRVALASCRRTGT
ncbi:hypothetical protein ACFWQC_27795 [Nocardioides sp. NPDC058538]|uniref:hypothetical protein n=1 Tax=Nocardioides sp. NPDC058538 TaxID=3346542 RepID=UPI0036597E96